MNSTFGPAYNKTLDRERILNQIDVIRDTMLAAGELGQWLTLEQIVTLTGYPAPSVSADLRHLRKKAFGGYIVNKKRLTDAGLWAYQVLRPTAVPIGGLFDA